MKKISKILSVLLSLCLLASAFTFTVFAESTSGTCGEGLTWTLDGEGNLVISGEGAMEDNYADWGTEIKSVVIGDSVTSIGASAFEYCSSLKSVTIGKSVESIGDYAFLLCDGLEQIVIPDSVVRIGNQAFDGCLSLKSVTVGSGVEEIGQYAFDYCGSLESITVSPSNKTFHSSGNCLIETETKKLVKGGKTSVIPSDGSVEVIGNSAFYYCSSLESIIIPDTVLVIEDYAFDGCESLKNVIIPDSVTIIGGSAFSYCASLESVKIGSSVEEIGGNAFYDCYSLKEINIPDSVTNIGYEAFAYCSSVETLTIGSGVEEIGDYAFDSCYSIEKITVSSLNTVYHSAGDCIIETETKTLIKGCKNSVIPSDGSVEVIGDSAFYGCYYLESIVIPEGVKTIDAYAFADCESLENVVISKTVESIGECAFADCVMLTRVYVPASVTSIGFCALGFYYDYDYDIDIDIDGWVVVDGFTIEGVKGTLAEEYAVENGITFAEAKKLPDADSMGYMDVSTMTMPNVVEKTIASDLISILAEYGIEATISNKNGEALQSNDAVGTGCVVSISDGDEYTVIVKGDVDGTGVITTTDYLIVKNSLIGKTDISGEYFVAADMDDNQLISTTDYLKIKESFLGK